MKLEFRTLWFHFYGLQGHETYIRETSFVYLSNSQFVPFTIFIFRVIRHINIQPGITQQDKFRLHIFEHGLQDVIGKKEIIAVLQPSRTEPKQVNASQLYCATTRVSKNTWHTGCLLFTKSFLKIRLESKWNRTSNCESCLHAQRTRWNSHFVFLFSEPCTCEESFFSLLHYFVYFVEFHWRAVSLINQS